MGRTQHPDLVGTVVIDTYKLIKRLGAGTFGAVYEAVDLTCSRQTHYAIKVLRNSLNDARLLMQEREWSTQMMVHEHPNILELHYVYVIGPYTYLVFDFCPGGTLVSSIQNKLYCYNDEMVKQSFVQLIDAVAYCHKLGVAHRDLKPDNILCSPDRKQLFIADFGLGTTDRFTTQKRIGSRFYMSPECVGKEGVIQSYSTQKADIWSLGVILVNIMCGVNLWREAKPEDDVFRDFMADPHYLRYSAPISREANALVHRILQPNPDDRISLSELREEVVSMESFFVAEAPPYPRGLYASPPPARPLPAAKPGRTGMPRAVKNITPHGSGAEADVSSNVFDSTPGRAGNFSDVTLESTAPPVTPEGRSRVDVNIVTGAMDALAVTPDVVPALKKSPSIWHRAMQKIKVRA
ncbi:kinase-like protein [Auriscalpium vulgare]|uniref:Kinase-like protein n=1 Tax=Auriscalpium vulgare TaxID=40419 RepID=A0ACB8R6J4_9AGAM|nr:kinase-like protein [Auriscalpium vulgare]